MLRHVQVAKHSGLVTIIMYESRTLPSLLLVSHYAQGKILLVKNKQENPQTRGTLLKSCQTKFDFIVSSFSLLYLCIIFQKFQ